MGFMNYCKNPVYHSKTETTQSCAGDRRSLEAVSPGVTACWEEKGSCLLAVVTSPGGVEAELLEALSTLQPALFLDMREALCPKEEFAKRIAPFLTDDRVFGRMYFGTLRDFQVEEKLEALRRQAKEASGLVLVFGFGAGSLLEPDLLLYADVSRWELQLRYRRGMTNYYTDNPKEDNLKRTNRAISLNGGSAISRSARYLTALIFISIQTKRASPPWRRGTAIDEPLRRSPKGPSAPCRILTPACGAASG